MDIVVHTEGQTEAEIITVEDTAIIGTLVAEGSGLRIWITRAGRGGPTQTVTFAEVGIKPHHHIHRGQSPHASHADVRYETGHKQHDVRPSATIGEVHEWAVGDRGFNLPADQRPKYDWHCPGRRNTCSSDVHVITLVGDKSPCISTCYRLTISAGDRRRVAGRSGLRWLTWDELAFG